jgi:F420-dependent oxidoreductase-like protein
MEETMKISISLDMTTENWEDARSYITEAERLGADMLWAPEAWGHDAVTPLAYAAAVTTKMRLGTGIMQAGTRTPALVAMTALSLAAMSNDRFVLGLGVSGPQVMEGWHGVPFQNSVGRMRELITVLRIAASGERVEFKGQHYELPLPGGQGKALRTNAAPHRIPVYLATLGPNSLELTGEIADGWIGTSFMPDHAEPFITRIEAGARRAGRSLADIDLQVRAQLAFGDDVERLCHGLKRGIAFSLGAMGSRSHNFYNRAVQRAGFEEDAREIQRLWLDGRRDEAVARVPDEIVLKSNLVGTDQMVRERLRVYRRAGVNALWVHHDSPALADRIEALARLCHLVAESNAEEAGETARPANP